MAILDNYLLNVPDPTEKVLAGVAAGNKLRDEREQRKITLAAREEEAELKTEIKELGPNPTAAEIADLVRRTNPEQAKQITDAHNLQSEDEQKESATFAGQALIALKHDPAYGVKILRDKAQALKNSGDMEGFTEMNRWADIAEEAPGMAVDVGLQMLALTDINAAQNVLNAQAGGREEALLNPRRDLMNAQAGQYLAGTATEEAMREGRIEYLAKQTELLDAEIVKSKAEALAIGVPEAWTTKEKAEFELKLVEKYDKHAKVYNESRVSFGRINAAYEMAARGNDVEKAFEKLTKAGKMPTTEAEFNKLQVEGKIPKTADFVSFGASGGQGVADVALIFSFMKMLDPGSVVRESEFANAQNTAGVPERIRVVWNKLLRGDKLSQQQRDKFMSLAKDFMQSAQEEAMMARTKLMPMIRDYKLTADNIFGNAEEMAAEDKKLGTGVLPFVAAVAGQPRHKQGGDYAMDPGDGEFKDLGMDQIIIDSEDLESLYGGYGDE